MDRALLRRCASVLICVDALWTLADFAAGPGQTHRYAAPDKSGIVEIVSAKREIKGAGYESRVGIQAGDRQQLCTIDYSSEDGQHGFSVVKAEWTPDSRFFVYSLTSSGGHQPWHTPTQFYDRAQGILRSLDDYFPGGISKADFLLVAPNTIETEAWRGRSMPITVSLAVLPAARGTEGRRPFVVSCEGGRVVKSGRQ